MLFLIHGDDVSKSRETIIQIVNKLNSIPNTTIIKKEVNISDITPQEVLNFCRSKGMFGEVPLIILDCEGTTKFDFGPFLDILHIVPSSSNVIFLSPKELTKSNALVKACEKLGIKVSLHNNLPDSNVFKFTEALFSKNRKATYTELHKLQNAGEDAFYIFSMILYSLRSIAAVTYGLESASKMAPFVVNKVNKQKDHFPDTKLKKLYETFYETDLGMKTGSSDPELLLTLAIEKVLR